MLLNEKHQFLIKKADEQINSDSHLVNNRYRPRYHITPRANWLNDPNGLVFFQGKYHVFYQHHPYSSQWGPMHWGHYVSKDLITWEALPIALAPSQPYDEDGCFSGSAIEHDGRLYLYYTGHSDSRTPKEVQCLAVSDDGVTFYKYDGNPVISAPPQQGSDDFRDPKVWKHEETWYMVIGSGKYGKGRVLLYRSTDLYSWEYVSVLKEGDVSQGFNWECPDVLTIDDKEVLMVSPEGVSHPKNTYMVGKMNYDAGAFETDYSGHLDEGNDFYAPQSFRDPAGRTILFGWMNMWNTKMPTQEDGWAGALTLPRQVQFNKSGQLTSFPVRELEKLRDEHWEFANIEITPESKNPLAAIRAKHVEIEIEYDLASSNANQTGIMLRCSDDGEEKTGLYYDRTKHAVLCNREKSGSGDSSSSICELKEKTDRLRLKIFVDTSSVEVFINGGVHVLTNRIYPRASSDRLELFSSGGKTTVTSFQMWRLRSALGAGNTK